MNSCSGWGPNRNSVQAVVGLKSRLLGEVPPFRPVAVKLMRFGGDFPYPVSQIADLLKSDPALTDEMKRFSRSTIAGGHEIRSSLQAVAQLGIDRINALIVTRAMRTLVGGSPGRFTLACWRHSLATALICEHLSNTEGLNKSRCYLAGMVHDIGRLAMLRVMPEVGEGLAAASARGQDLLLMEQVLLGMDHAMIGRWLLGQWSFPLELQMVAGMHENAGNVPGCDCDLINLVRAGSAIADSLGFSTFPLAASQHPEWPDRTLAHNERFALPDYPQLESSILLVLNEIECSLA